MAPRSREYDDLVVNRKGQQASSVRHPSFLLYEVGDALSKYPTGRFKTGDVQNNAIGQRNFTSVVICNVSHPPQRGAETINKISRKYFVVKMVAGSEQRKVDLKKQSWHR